MSRLIRFTLALTVSAALGPHNLAEPVEAESSPARITERISIDLEEGQALGLFGSFAKIMGCELRLDPAVADRKVSITLQRVRLSLALDTLCDSIGCDWRLESAQKNTPCVLVVGNALPMREAREAADIETLLAEPVSMQLQDADFAEVVRSFGTLLVAKLDLPDNLGGEAVTLDLKNSSVRDALDAILSPAGYLWHLTESNGDRVFKVWKE